MSLENKPEFMAIMTRGIELAAKMKEKNPETNRSISEDILRSFRLARREGTLDIPTQRQMAIAGRFRKRFKALT